MLLCMSSGLRDDLPDGNGGPWTAGDERPRMAADRMEVWCHCESLEGARVRAPRNPIGSHLSLHRCSFLQRLFQQGRSSTGRREQHNSRDAIRAPGTGWPCHLCELTPARLTKLRRPPMDRIERRRALVTGAASAI